MKFVPWRFLGMMELELFWSGIAMLLFFFYILILVNFVNNQLHTQKNNRPKIPLKNNLREEY